MCSEGKEACQAFFLLYVDKTLEKINHMPE